MLKNKHFGYHLRQVVSQHKQRKIMNVHYSLEAFQHRSVINLMCDLCNKCPQTTDLHTQGPAHRKCVWMKSIRGPNERKHCYIPQNLPWASFSCITFPTEKISTFTNLFLFFCCEEFPNNRILTRTHTVQLKFLTTSLSPKQSYTWGWNGGLVCTWSAHLYKCPHCWLCGDVVLWAKTINTYVLQLIQVAWLEK